MQSLINTVISQAAAKGISQKALAARAGVPPETLSRMKRRSPVRAGVLERLALGAGLRLALVDVGVADVGFRPTGMHPGPAVPRTRSEQPEARTH